MHDFTSGKPADKRPSKALGVHFKCCNVYRYIYKTRDGSAYAGMCPKCGKRVRFPIGEDGVDSRLFEAW